MDQYVVTTSFPCMDFRCPCLRKKKRKKRKGKEKEINTLPRISRYLSARYIYHSSKLPSRITLLYSSVFYYAIRVPNPSTSPPLPELLKTIKRRIVRRCKIFLSSPEIITIYAKTPFSVSALFFRIFVRSKRFHVSFNSRLLCVHETRGKISL